MYKKPALSGGQKAAPQAAPSTSTEPRAWVLGSRHCPWPLTLWCLS